MKVCKQEEVLVELCLTMRMIWIGIHLSFLQRQQHLRHQPLYLCRKKCNEYWSNKFKFIPDSTGLLECCLCPLFLEWQDPVWKWTRNSQLISAHKTTISMRNSTLKKAWAQSTQQVLIGLRVYHISPSRLKG